MKGSQIHKMLRGVKKYGGILASDELKYAKPGKMYVVNTKPRRHPGEHWIVLDWSRRLPYFFDSFGHSPKYYGFPPMQHWKKHLQDPNSDTCGLYCIYYVMHRAKHYSPERMFELFPRKNDARLLMWYNKV